MPRPILYCFSTIIAFVFFTLSLAAAAEQSPGECPRIEVLKGIKQAAANDGAVIEPVHVKTGLLVLVVAKTEPGIAALSRAVDAYESARTKYLSAKAEGACNAIWNAIAGRELEESIKRTSTGFIVVYSSANQDIVEKLHKSECCSWCVCPAGTVTQCTSCC